MGNYENLKQSITEVIRTNGNQEITGAVLQSILLTIISTVGANATFAGIATPTTNPGTPDQNVFYIASEAGTYSNFGSIELQDGLSVLIWNGSWSSQQIFGIDDEPTTGSDNLVKSGGVAEDITNTKSMFAVESTAIRERSLIVDNVHIDETGKVVSGVNRRLLYIYLLKGIYKVSLKLNSSFPLVCALFDDVPAINSQASKVLMINNTPNSEEQFLLNVEEDNYVAFSNYATMDIVSVVEMTDKANQYTTIFQNKELNTTEEDFGYVSGTVGGSISIDTNQNYYHKQYDVSTLNKVFIRLKTHDNKGVPFIFLIDENDIIQYRYEGYTVDTLIEEYLDVHNYSKIVIQYYKGGYFGNVSQVSEISIKDYLRDVPTEKQIYGKGKLLQDGYLPNAFIYGSKILTGSTRYYRIKYVEVTEGDKLALTVTDTGNEHVRGIYYTQSVPAENVSVEEVSVTNDDIDTLYEATKDGYILVYYYATGDGSINEALLPSEYTDEAIENLVRPYPVYYEKYIEDKLQSFYDVNKVNSRQSDSFVFITDIHIGRNWMQSPKLIEGIMQRSVINKVFFGGDIPGPTATKSDLYKYWLQFLEFYNRINPLGILFNVRGNHDWRNYVQDEEGVIELPKSEVYATLMDKYNPNLLVHQGDNMEYPCYYYVDNSHAKIRYIILDGSDEEASVTEDNYAQGIWLKNTLNETPEGYDVIVFSHISLSDVVWTEPMADYMDMLKQANSRQGDFADCKCTVKVVFAGHSHYDFQNWDGGILNIVTDCDYYGNSAYYPVNDAPLGVRWGYGGTVLEQSFDVCNIDFGNNVINLIKIGFGPSRRIHLTPISMSVSDTRSWRETISGTVSWYSYNADSAFSKESLVNDVVSIDETTGLITALKAGSAVVMAKNAENDREFWEIVVS